MHGRDSQARACCSELLDYVHPLALAVFPRQPHSEAIELEVGKFRSAPCTALYPAHCGKSLDADPVLSSHFAPTRAPSMKTGDCDVPYALLPVRPCDMAVLTFCGLERRKPSSVPRKNVPPAHHNHVYSNQAQHMKTAQAIVIRSAWKWQTPPIAGHDTFRGMAGWAAWGGMGRPMQAGV